MLAWRDLPNSATFQPISETNHAMQPRTRYYWLALLLAGALFCSLALFVRTNNAVAGSKQTESFQPVKTPSAPTETYEGIVTDTHCQAKHSAKAGLSAGDCTRACVHGGEHFALVDGDKAYVLEGEADALKRTAGERVKIAGALNGNTITVASVTDDSKAE
jgi:hypothetical protein